MLQGITEFTCSCSIHQKLQNMAVKIMEHYEMI